MEHNHSKQINSKINIWIPHDSPLPISTLNFNNQAYSFTVEYDNAENFSIYINDGQEPNIVTSLSGFYQSLFTKFDKITNLKKSDSTKICASGGGDTFDYHHNSFHFQLDFEDLHQTLTYEEGILVLHLVNLCHWIMSKLLNLEPKKLQKIQQINDFTYPIYKASVQKQLIKPINFTKEVLDIIEFYDWKELQDLV